MFASTFGCVAFSSVAMRTSNAAADSSPARQIISVNASIFSSSRIHWSRRYRNPIINDGLARINPPHELGKPRIIDFQTVSDNRACDAPASDRPVVNDSPRASFQSIADGVCS